VQCTLHSAHPTPSIRGQYLCLFIEFTERLLFVKCIVAGGKIRRDRLSLILTLLKKCVYNLTLLVRLLIMCKW
jgi:hypothetical protein